MAAVQFRSLDRPLGDGAMASPFSATWSDTLVLLQREADQVGAREVVVCVDAAAGNMRQDGGMRADAKVRTDGVEVYLPASDVGPLRFTCHRFYGVRWRGSRLAGWQVNVRAVALGMEALRKVERYGLGTGTEQYRGWNALGAGAPVAMGPATMTLDEAAAVLATAADAGGSATVLLYDAELIGNTYRLAARRHHPDAGGDPAAFRRITEARDLLLAHAG